MRSRRGAGGQMEEGRKAAGRGRSGKGGRSGKEVGVGRSRVSSENERKDREVGRAGRTQKGDKKRRTSSEDEKE